MRSKKWLLVVVAALVASLAFAAATSAQAGLEDGDYTLTLPGITGDGDFEFTIDSTSDVETVVAVAAPDGYEVDDDDPDKAAWKNAASLEVEVKLDKVEADVDWASDATLALPGGGNITVSWDGTSFTVTASGGWYAFGSGNDWYVANNSDINLADAFFKVEPDEDGIELKAVDAVDDGFLNDLTDDEEEEEAEVESEDDGEGKANGKDKGRGKGGGSGA